MLGINEDRNKPKWFIGEQRRQGDVFITRVEKLPDTKAISENGSIILYPKKDGVLHEGEKTGHKHEFNGGTAQILLLAEKPKLETEAPRILRSEELPSRGSKQLLMAYVKVEGAMQELVHPEHKPIKMGEGIYEITRQREHNEVGRPTIVED